MPSPSPSLYYVHATASVYKRFASWLRRASKNYDELLKWKAVVDYALRRERAEDPELDVEQRAMVADQIREYDKLNEGLLRLVRYKAFETFGETGELFIKWVGEETVSVGYGGFRERSAQYWLSDIRLTDVLPFEKKARDVLRFFEVERLGLLKIPSQEEAESTLLDFLENVKGWSREKLRWVVKNAYPLSDATGGFFSAARKVVELESLRDAWEDIISGWKRFVVDDLKVMPEYEVLKAVFLSAWEAERYLRDLADDLEKEFLDKYGETTENVEKVRGEFEERASKLLKERVAPELRLREVYEEVKPLIPAEKVELTRAGLWKAIRWAFLHPTMSLDAFASGHVFPLGFTTEEARAIASKIMEKVVIKPPVPPPPKPPPIEYVKVRFLKETPAIVGADMKIYGPFKEGDIVELPKLNAEALVKTEVATYELVVPPPVKVSKEEFMRLFDEDLAEWLPHYIELRKAGFEGDLRAEVPELAEETIRRFTVEEVKERFKDDIASEKETAWKSYDVATPEFAKVILERLPDRARRLADDWVLKTQREMFEEAKAVAVKPPPPIPPPVVPPLPPEKRPLRELPEQIKDLKSRLMEESYARFIAEGVPREEWEKHRGSISSEIELAVEMFQNLAKLDAEAKISGRLDKFVTELIKQIKPPPPPPVVPPPYVRPPGVPAAVVERPEYLKAEVMRGLRPDMKPEEVKRVVKDVYGWDYTDEAAASFYRERCLQMGWALPPWIKRYIPY